MDIHDQKPVFPIFPVLRGRAVVWMHAFLVALTLGADLAICEESGRFYVREYRVEGSKRLEKIQVEEAVYPFMGPGRSPDDVEQARQALEKIYHQQGYQTVSVSIPEQDPRRGIIRLQVSEGKVGRLRVKGARWFLPSRIRKEVPSMAEGTVPNLDQVGKEMIALNRMADRRVTPDLRPGMEPGSVDIELTVEDTLPLHGSLELNNRYSADTTPLRLNGALSYGNLFQLGHTLGVNAQVAPENTEDALVYSAYYLARVSETMSLMVNGTKQDSDISTLGGAAVAGKGEIVGLRAMVDLPNAEKFFHNFNFGIDYKNFDEDIVIDDDTISSPIEYYPLSANYSASWIAEKCFTELNTSLNLHLRGMGSDTSDYAEKRFNASGNFIYLRGDLAHTRDIKGGAQLFGKIQGQVAGQPLINSEQISGGGLGTVRGYLEATALGDNGIFGTVEYRTPTLIGRGDTSANPADEWRFHAFADVGMVGIYDPLSGQKKRTGLSSVGLGSRIQVRKHYHGSVDVAVPLLEQTNAEDGDIRITFRGWADF
jgi:hemolysin activation/secretion protein